MGSATTVVVAEQYASRHPRAVVFIPSLLIPQEVRFLALTKVCADWLLSDEVR